VDAPAEEESMSMSRIGKVSWAGIVGVLACAFSVVACTAQTSGSGSGTGTTGSTTGGGGDAGTPTQNGSSTADAGKSICKSVTDCEKGLTCQRATIGTDGMCTVGCSTNADCPSGGECVSGSSIGLAPSCARTCSTSNDCSAGMSCFSVDNGKSVCLPQDWVTPAKGIGDSCVHDSDCTSGMCTATGGATGWCTKTCSGDSTISCAGSHNGKNENGEDNWCVKASDNNYYCFPGCDTTSSSCNEYASTSCRSANTYNGNSRLICTQ
jgi:hypothetical protein